jgi:hypothetical protein
MSDAEVPSADALDQDRPVDPDTPDDDIPREIPADVPAADAFEQARELPLDDDAAG